MGFWNEVLLNVYAYGLAALGSGLAVGALYFTSRVKRLWPMQRAQRGAWTGREVLFAFFLFYLTLDFARGLLEFSGFFVWFYGQPLSDQPIDLARRAVWSTPLGYMLLVPLCLWMLRVTNGDRLADAGLGLGRWRQNVMLGCLGFVLGTPLILGVFFATLLVFQQFEWAKVPHHFELLAAQSLIPAEWLLIFVVAILFAPIVEELLFRGVLQGWLVRAAPPAHAVVAAIAVTLLTMPYVLWFSAEEKAPFPGWGLPIFFGILLAGYAAAFRWTWLKFLREVDRIEAAPQAQRPLDLHGHDPAAAVDEDMRAALRRHALAWQQVSPPLAMFGSALLFAACHPAWPAPIPLFLLGLVLGYLAYRTQSLVAPLVLHALFNTVASLVLVFSQG